VSGAIAHARIHTYAGTDTHTGLRFLSASNQPVSRWSDENNWNVALLLPVRAQSLRYTNTNSYTCVYYQRLSTLFFCSMLFWICRSIVRVVCAKSITNAAAIPSSERLYLL